MLRDVFYYGIKPNVHPREKFAKNLKDARDQATTQHFWVINEHCDYTNFDWDFDFDFLPDDDVWAQDHNNVWPSQHQKDSGTWLCSKEYSEVIVYRADVDFVKRKPCKENFVLLQKVDTNKFDFSWHPDPTDPPYIYCWGNKFFPPQFGHAVEYHVENATEIKYMSTIVELLPNLDNFEVFDDIEFFDFSWLPDPGSPPYIYVWGNQWNKPEDKISIRYVVEGATEYKYMQERVTRKPCMENWELPKNINSKGFDFSWEPSPADPPYIYEFGTQWQKTGGPRYVVADATEFKYINFQKVIALPTKDQWVIPNNIEIDNFDFSWHPDNTDPAYIYQFGTQWALSGGPKYIVEGASEVKYVDDLIAVALPNKENWEVNDFIDTENFDYSWHPYAEDEPYIYQFGTQWQKTGGPKYITPGVHKNSPIKYIDRRILQARRLPNKKGYAILNNYKIKDFDYSWHPDETDEPYIYVFGNNQYPAEIMPTIEYVVPGAKQIKYVNDIVAVLDQDRTNWVITQAIDEDKFDFSWKPNPTDPPYIYRWGNKYISNKYKPTIEYHVADATDIKYMDDDVNVIPEWERWIIPKDIDTTGFDFTWRPDPLEPDYIYEFGTQWQKTGGPRYIVPNATEYKYINSQKVKALPNKDKWLIPNNIEIDNFDFSWHPDNTDPAYIYQFGTQWALSGGPKYIVEGATEIKYVDDLIAVALPNKENWVVPIDIDESSFDFSWHPYAEDEPYIYQFGTQWQKTGGPKYITPGTTGISATKYIDVRILKSKRLPTMNNWVVPKNITIKSFDYSWHPDSTDELFVYEFGTQWHEKGGPKYVPPGAKIGITPTKYIPTTSCVAILDINMKHWEVPTNIDRSNFDYSWVPHPDESTYIYQFGTQHQKTGGPRYITMGSNNKSPVKYIDTLKAVAVSNKSKYKILQNLKIKDFDYSWHPDETDEPYIYVFGNNQYPAEIMPTIEYRIPNATEIKYINDIKAILDIDLKNWIIPNDLDTSNFDFSWKPNPKDPPYIYQFGTQWQKTGGPRYIVEGATETKYIDGSRAKKLENKNLFKVIGSLKIKDFDYSWHPDNTEQPYIYIFGNNQHTAEVMPTIEYKVENATEIKYINDIKAILDIDLKNWIIPNDLDTSNFDFSWKPNPKDPPYIYQFGTQWQKTGGPRYIVEGATKIKYIDGSRAKNLENKNLFKIIGSLKIKDFDYSWHPDETDEPYIYIFGNNQYPAEIMPTIEYRIPNATEIKYVNNNIAVLATDKKHWNIPDDIDTEGFDFSWKPNPHDPPFIYQFGTQHQKTGGPRYIVEGATEIKYIDSIKATRKASKYNWEIPNDIKVDDFDFSWHPDELAPAYIYQFGTLLNSNDGPRYITPNNNREVVNKLRLYIEPVVENTDYIENIEIDTMTPVNTYYIKTTLQDLINEHPNEVFWALNKDIDYNNFDFSYRPNIEQAKFIHSFGYKDNIDVGTYFVSSTMYDQGNKEFNYIKLTEPINYITNIFYVDKGNKNSELNFQKLQNRFGKRIQKTRYLNSWVETINRCINRSTSTLCWILNSELDYSEFNFEYYPNIWQIKMVHVFGTQYNHWGTTFLVNKNTFAEDTKYIKVIEHLSNLNFVKNITAKSISCNYDVYCIDFKNNNSKYNIDKVITNIQKPINIIDYNTDYTTTLKKLVNSLPNKKENYIWICSSICDYTDFDFNYIVDPFSREDLHVFPSNNQKMGDTFFVDGNKLKEQLEKIDNLKLYHKINYNYFQKTSRDKPPVIISDESHVSNILDDFDFPYAVFITKDNNELVNIVDEEPISLWSDDTKNIIITSTGGSRVIVPKEIKNHFESQLYDYPYIKTNNRLHKSIPMDIVFLSNGETCADSNYEHLLKITKGLKNRVVKVENIKGRAEAYKAAAKASNTPWMFTVFAKLKVNPKFDFNWQPDRLQIPKHYIFHAKNPVNNLVYGHQGIIMYNKNLVLSNIPKGLDFTLDSPHETVPLLSGEALYNTDEFTTWRTAFREVIKLKCTNTKESLERLQIWLTVGNNNYGEYSIKGAIDGIEYYEDVDGDINKLKFSYEWQWLNDYFCKKF